MSQVPEEDSRAASIVGFLREQGAANARHGAGRSLLVHLVETYWVLRRWQQPAWLQHAGLLHSVYGTDVYRRQLLARSRRDEVAEVAGARAERLAYLFCVTPRKSLLVGTNAWARHGAVAEPGGAGSADTEPAADRDELDALVLLHMANLAEQSRAEGGTPGRWLVALREAAEQLITSDSVDLPLFIAELASFSDEDESSARRAYHDGLNLAEDLEWRATRFGLAAAICPVVAEPCVWLACLALCRRDQPAARTWAARAQMRLQALGTTWDKRASFEEWLELAERLEHPRTIDLPAEATAIGHPHALLDAIRSARGGGSPTPARGSRGTGAVRTDPEEARRRFQRYVEALATPGASAPGAVYPGLESQPWYEAQDFPLVRYLESHYAAIRDEILGLDPSAFHRESERIKRSGEWDVAFLYERGRRHDEACEACPVTTRGIEAYPAIRTMTGLIYASRLRASTHIRAHRGPTNLRLRCHLGISVPEGDCAIRVGHEVRQWREGRCLVFDDYFEHEAWNHTAEDRVVLIVDMWHPGLSATEVRLLEGLHAYTDFHARRLGRYWSVNAEAAAARQG